MSLLGNHYSQPDHPNAMEVNNNGPCLCLIIKFLKAVLSRYVDDSTVFEVCEIKGVSFI